MAKKSKGMKNRRFEVLLIDLHEIVKTSSIGKEKASSLIDWYMANRAWTPKQLKFVKYLIKAHKRKKKNKDKPKKYNLYAIGDGEAVKLGISTNVHRRLKGMQTSHPKKLSILWRFYTGRDRKAGYKAEKKLQRLCKRHLIRGEWFKPDCMVLVNQFTLKEKIVLEQEQKEHDLLMIENSPL